MDEWARRLVPDSSSLPADRFHPWVGDAARNFWESQHCRAAVLATATSVNARLQTKLGRRDLSDAGDLTNVRSGRHPPCWSGLSHRPARLRCSRQGTRPVRPMSRSNGAEIFRRFRWMPVGT
ncbi:TIGR02391 family protein [Streptomyces sp. NBC_00988]|uniref:TIGR02391 family protein n=1 Tax=Streptomyces sp. NBC_00988 TaxID=2903704 RepID=UPI0038700864